MAHPPETTALDLLQAGDVAGAVALIESFAKLPEPAYGTDCRTVPGFDHIMARGTEVRIFAAEWWLAEKTSPDLAMRMGALRPWLQKIGALPI